MGKVDIQIYSRVINQSVVYFFEFNRESKR